MKDNDLLSIFIQDKSLYLITLSFVRVLTNLEYLLKCEISPTLRAGVDLTRSNHISYMEKSTSACVMDFTKGKPFLPERNYSPHQKIPKWGFLQMSDYVTSSFITVQRPLTSFGEYRFRVISPYPHFGNLIYLHFLVGRSLFLFLNKPSLLPLDICTCYLERSCPRSGQGLFPHSLQVPA